MFPSSAGKPREVAKIALDSSLKTQSKCLSVGGLGGLVGFFWCFFCVFWVVFF